MEADQQNSDQNKSPRNSQKWFWLALVSPAAISLLSFWLGTLSKDTGAVVGFADLIIGAVASIYCSYWLVHRFFKSDGSRVFFGLLITLGLGFVNFMIICAGCAGNLLFR